MPAEKFGRYEIKSEIGRGGMATVYEAYDPLFKRDVAIKVLPRELLHDPTFRARFEREGQVIASLEHPAIVPVYDFGEQDGDPYLVMRLMSGASLATRIGTGPLLLAEAAHIISRLAPALDEAHAKGIIHRDLKPGNILFDRRDDSFISDFGIVKLSEGSMAFTGNVVLGTPAYMSPEQARGDVDIDGRSDIYSLGVILFEMLTGQLPYHSDTPMGLAVKHITEPLPSILAVKPDLPAGVEPIITRALAKDPDQRYQTAAEMASELETLAGHPVVVAPPFQKTLVGEPTPIVTPAAQSVIAQTPEPGKVPISPGAISDDAPPHTKRSRPRVGVWVLAAVVLFGILVAILWTSGVFASLTVRAGLTDLDKTATAIHAGSSDLDKTATAIHAGSSDLDKTATAIHTGPSDFDKTATAVHAALPTHAPIPSHTPTATQHP